MIALFDFVPRYCPNCGKDTRLLRPATEAERRNGITSYGDFLAGASHACLSCGMKYQYADKAEMLKAAANSGGDLKQYA